MDLERALQSQPFSSITYGSEFRPVPILVPLLGQHPLWPRVREYLTNGVEHPLRPISEVECLHDLSRMLKYGNHKSANKEKSRLLSMLQDKVHRMWQLPLPLKALPRIPRGVLAPLGMVQQDSINERGEIVDKWRLTHDQMYEIVPGANRSVNHRVLFEELTPCKYGRAILRYVYSILFLRMAQPTKRILQTKADLKAAYR